MTDRARPDDEPEPDPDADPGAGSAADATWDSWQQIVANYGERAVLDDRPEPEPEAEAVRIDALLPSEPVTTVQAFDEPVDHFVPAPPPPVALPRGPRLLAWLGVLGIPVLIVLLAVSDVSLPRWLAVLLIGWFLGGFGYLVRAMPREPRDDDGAVV